MPHLSDLAAQELANLNAVAPTIRTRRRNAQESYLMGSGLRPKNLLGGVPTQSPLVDRDYYHARFAPLPGAFF